MNEHEIDQILRSANPIRGEVAPVPSTQRMTEIIMNDSLKTDVERGEFETAANSSAQIGDSVVDFGSAGSVKRGLRRFVVSAAACMAIAGALVVGSSVLPSGGGVGPLSSVVGQQSAGAEALLRASSLEAAKATSEPLSGKWAGFPVDGDFDAVYKWMQLGCVPIGPAPMTPDDVERLAGSALTEAQPVRTRLCGLGAFLDATLPDTPTPVRAATLRVLASQTIGDPPAGCDGPDRLMEPLPSMVIGAVSTDPDGASVETRRIGVSHDGEQLVVALAVGDSFVWAMFAPNQFPAGGPGCSSMGVAIANLPARGDEKNLAGAMVDGQLPPHSNNQEPPRDSTTAPGATAPPATSPGN